MRKYFVELIYNYKINYFAYDFEIKELEGEIEEIEEDEDVYINEFVSYPYRIPINQVYDTYTEALVKGTKVLENNMNILEVTQDDLYFNISNRHEELRLLGVEK